MERPFERILIIMFENQYRQYVMANPYMRGLARQGLDMANFHGVMHPSQTNYIASIAGELCNVTDDDQPPELLPQRTIVDLIEEAPGELQWKAYMDGYRPAKTPWTPTLVPQDDYPYVIKHDPFSSFERIVRSESRWQRIVNETQFFVDVLSGTLPHYAWFTPDMWNDGHYVDGTQTAPDERAPVLVDQLAAWLEGFFGALSFPGPDSRLPRGTLVVVTFDEADFEGSFDQGKKYTYDGPNQVYTVLLGDMIEPGVVDESYNHYNLIKTIELNFGLGDLGKNDAAAAPLRVLWKQRFSWGTPGATPLRTHGHVGCAALGQVLHVVVRDEDGMLRHTTWSGGTWGTPRPIGVRASGPLAMASSADALVLAFVQGTELLVARYDLQTGWSAPQVQGSAGGAVAIAALPDDGLMLAWVDPEGVIQSRRCGPEGWAATVSTGQHTRGALALGAIGPSLQLVFQDPESSGLRALSYNTAPFNVTTLSPSKYSGPWDDTTRDQWSPSAFVVGRFTAAPFPGTPGELEPVLDPVRAGAPLALAPLDGVLHLVHPGESNEQLLTERFSTPGILTPKLPVSYDASKEQTTSNGYGTLAEADWTPTEPIDHMWIAAGGALGMATVDDQLILLAQPEVGGPLVMTLGSIS
ncbi:alkaline phosphatase family protein [Paraliomyxa miuraensis]|uniref:alkaline phosphatase family protein n=1 Tax=Paraliomyxa miuraensis TaxID=376150 RepID=UPI00225B93AA|nr:alkaline phosphatase family protein [Paraliomyxa miuraensis]MCX4240390.1 alkaline phosphatase family protein [Paraliomyxa miuraensis]